MPSTRLIVDDALDGGLNMAIDQALLVAANESQSMTLRFYQWIRPTLSLGYFQAIADRHTHGASLDCDVVRRATGGGAIVHDRELTYSLVVPAGSRSGLDHRRLYRSVHQALLATLWDLGIVGGSLFEAESTGSSREPFLCFLRRSPGDVILSEHKICGSAQRRHHGAVLQHGSLLLAQSPAAPELPGIADLDPAPVTLSELQELWAQKIAEQLQVAWNPGTLSELETAAAVYAIKDRFRNRDWTEKR